MTCYVEKIKTPAGIQTIGGPSFDDGWVYNSVVLANNLTIGKAETVTISLDSYLPDDGYDYAVIIAIILTTGEAVGDTIDAQICSGSVWNTTNFYRRVARCITGNSSYIVSGGSAEIPISSADRAITVYNGDGDGSGRYVITVTAYKRLGTNGKEANYIEKIKTHKNDLTIGGSVLNGDIVYSYSKLFSGTITNGSSKTISLASYLPDDGHDYICYFNLTFQGGTSGKVATVRVSTVQDSANSTLMGNVLSRSSSAYYAGGNLCAQVSAGNKAVTIYNVGKTSASSCTLYVRAYRRVVANPLDTDGFISNINDIPIGGNVADGQWVGKLHTVFSDRVFAASEGVKSYTVNNYLPDNDNIYEVQFTTYSSTLVKSGQSCTWWAFGNARSIYQVCGYIKSLTASGSQDGKSGVLICKQDSAGNMTISTDATSSVKTGGCGLQLTAYRRIGTNK